ncbi:2-amino-4-hydroxy-6-hydroxymethyldihydropteridine diphosphokinase [Sphingobium subterraneum]|uniref:2-amino-4-hydroxy-6-hydroxymethyldihydropteridine pyrophosphokinase n=1 Tax=Sphingobium subterraneum TaxID=627688 RepID=A0A841IYC1_9SPHN|nr:2-amino-4-hydroxy-6-hydroxymethyldihydropteridine diphosphokinase [Sphingobium subterraneum]MBB6123607.1 2-amino-4-hydroxy-6-hydroxymethyldihydropteridine diphosphokinase [Sphingobium subterraneum]
MGAAANPFLYALGIGSNQARSARLTPRAMVNAALADLAQPPFSLIARSTIINTAPLGPSLRRYANAAALVATDLPPPAVLAALKSMERAAGRRQGRRWAARPLDLDILLWSGGRVDGRSLTIPHPAFRSRDFVLRPLQQVAPRWRDPITALTTRHLHARAKKPKPVDRSAPRH